LKTGCFYSDREAAVSEDVGIHAGVLVGAAIKDESLSRKTGNASWQCAMVGNGHGPWKSWILYCAYNSREMRFFPNHVLAFGCCIYVACIFQKRKVWLKFIAGIFSLQQHY
jgi:hypothetical protein